MRIVFCEDEPMIRKLIELSLRGTPHRFHMAADGREALELVRRWRPEVARGLTKHGKHEALADIYESIEELKYYREKFLRLED